jgi:hypothetical protein
MVLVRRFGGWRPVDSAAGVGRLRRAVGAPIEGARYHFEVWHQFSGGFEGPYRAEGDIFDLDPEALASLVGVDSVLELEDGRFMTVRVSPDSRMLAHQQPDDRDPWPREPD